MRLVTRIAFLVAAVLLVPIGAAMVGQAGASPASSPATTRHAAAACPATQCVVARPGGIGELDEAAAGAAPGTPWEVNDPNGAAMAWVNLYGMYSGGDGGKMPGGLLCVTYGVSATVACLTPTGDLTLRATGPDGPTGPAETLTPRDIAWIHRHGG